ncbi:MULTISPECIES: hypothetical protein [unclassified Pseudoalteromonas]|uniref:hypothetical protein n=1 Tax=unclassified Pseudoalteromonas TaxID=194690 RepID=UPI0016019D65|nr:MULTISPECIES: hypothetical protein [unclassified Pseudoalteromonas]MBB1398606.1 hypothetical protein [Pseudoalteromonas sp. SG44-8]MBB1409859.1 hypothetical protein [Pseudoalteromonas sp. SG44-17]
MKFSTILVFILILFSESSFARSHLPYSCEEYSEIELNSFVLFNKKQFIELGECAGEALVKAKKIYNIAAACSEVVEDKNSLLGIFSLSKVEAIKMGVCFGAINAVYNRYDRELVLVNSRYRSTKRYYSCKKGMAAVDELVASAKDEYYKRSELRDILCDRVY